jgi:hypothetical protein
MSERIYIYINRDGNPSTKSTKYVEANVNTIGLPTIFHGRTHISELEILGAYLDWSFLHSIYNVNGRPIHDRYSKISNIYFPFSFCSNIEAIMSLGCFLSGAFTLGVRDSSVKSLDTKLVI